MKTAATLAGILAATIIIFSGCDRDLDEPPYDKEFQTLTLHEIYELYDSLPEGTDTLMLGDYMLFGTITMDDVSGNIYKEAYIQDDTHGINLYKLDRAGIVHEGDYVRIALNNAVVKDYQGKLEISFQNIRNCDERIISQKHEPLLPETVTIEQIESDSFNCKLVRVNELRFLEDGCTFVEANERNTNRTVEASNGKQLTVRTSSYADFAHDTLPNDTIDIVGIATKHKNTYQILIRHRNEITPSASISN